MITCSTNKLQKVILGGGCKQNGTPTPDNPIDIVCNNGVLKFGRIGKNLVNPNVVTQNSYINYSGGISSDNGYVISDYIPVQSRQKITISTADTTAYPFGGAGSKAFYDSDKNYISNSASQNSAISAANPVTLVVPGNAAYFRTTIRKSSISYAQVEYGGTATTFEPYKAGIYADGTQEVITDSLGNTATAEMLLNVGGYKDEQEVLSGSVTRNIGIKVLDGTEAWGWIGAEGHIWRGTAYLSNFSALNGSIAISTHFSQPIAFLANSNLFIRYLDDYNITLLETWKQYLASQYANGTPVIIVYPLATPTTEQVTPQPLVGNIVTQTAGSIDNLPIESSTIAELKKRYIGDKEVKRVYIGENLVWENN